MEKFDDSSHTIVLGKFKNSSQAEALRDKLSLNGFLSGTKKTRVQTNIHIVQLGPFESLPQASKVKRNIDRAGFDNSFYPLRKEFSPYPDLTSNNGISFHFGVFSVIKWITLMFSTCDFPHYAGFSYPELDHIFLNF